MIDSVIARNEIPALWRGAMIIPVLHCPNGHGNPDVERLGSRDILRLFAR
jgi:hypothetical protein